MQSKLINTDKLVTSENTSILSLNRTSSATVASGVVLDESVKRSSLPSGNSPQQKLEFPIRPLPKDDSTIENLLSYYNVLESASSILNSELERRPSQRNESLKSQHLSEPADIKSSVKEDKKSASHAPVTSLTVEEMVQAPESQNDSEMDPVAQAAASCEKFDSYGFTKAKDSSSDEINSLDYKKYLEKRASKWKRACGPKSELPSKNSKTARYVRKGIHPKLRGDAWFCYSGAKEHFERQPNLYPWILEQSATLTVLEDVEFIERDLHRTFPDNIYFMSSPKRSSVPTHTSLIPEYLKARPGEQDLICKLRRVLVAFSIHVPRAGYCQSLNFIAGLMLLFLNEEKAFWLLLILTQKYLPHVHDISLEGASIDQTVLMLLIKEHLPKIWNKIGQNFDGIPSYDLIARLPPITLVTSSWFMSCFIGSLPMETVMRIWDCLFYDGSVVLFRCALAILKIGEKDILRLNESVDIFQLVQNIPKTLNDPRSLIDLMYRRRSGLGSITQAEIDRKRYMVAQKRKEQYHLSKNKNDQSHEKTIKFAGPPKLQVDRN